MIVEQLKEGEWVMLGGEGTQGAEWHDPDI